MNCEFEEGAARFLRRLDAAADPAEVWAAAQEAFGLFGPGWLSYVVVDPAGGGLLAWRTSMPTEAERDYAARGMADHDYRRAHSIASRGLMSWEVAPDASPAEAGESILLFDRFLADHGRRHVLVQPFHEARRRIGVSLVLDAPWKFGAPGLARFRYFANLLRAHYRWDGDPGAAPQLGPHAGLALLTAREREALRRIADGLTPAEAAGRMGLSAPALRKHLAAARAKLGAATREQAVAAAHRLGLMQPVAKTAPGARPGGAGAPPVGGADGEET